MQSYEKKTTFAIVDAYFAVKTPFFVCFFQNNLYLARQAGAIPYLKTGAIPYLKKYLRAHVNARVGWCYLPSFATFN